MSGMELDHAITNASNPVFAYPMIDFENNEVPFREKQFRIKRALVKSVLEQNQD